MSTLDTPAPTHRTVEPDHDGHAHPTEAQYWWVFIVLAIITAVEVLWSYLGLSGPALVVPLMVMMVVKFIFIAGIFMHLHYDGKVPNGKVFLFCFGSGLVLAVGVFVIVFAAFNFQI